MLLVKNTNICISGFIQNDFIHLCYNLLKIMEKKKSLTITCTTNISKKTLTCKLFTDLRGMALTVDRSNFTFEEEIHQNSQSSENSQYSGLQWQLLWAKLLKHLCEWNPRFEIQDYILYSTYNYIPPGRRTILPKQQFFFYTDRAVNLW